MNKIIYKYPLDFTYPQTIKLPSSAEILYVDSQRNTPTIWAIIDTDDKSTIEVDVYIIWYLGKLLMLVINYILVHVWPKTETFVWHIFIDYSKSENIILPGVDL